MRVLIVDDEKGIRDHLRHLLTGKGHQVTMAASAKEAISVLEGLSPDIVVVDISIPGGDGRSLLRYVREREPHCPVIVTTAFGSRRSAAEALSLGAYDYVTKPFDPDSVLAAVRRAADYRHLQQAVSEAQEKLATQALEMSALYDTALDMATFLSLPEVLESLLSRAMALLRAKGGNVCLYDETQQQLVIATCRGPWGDLMGRTLALGEGLAGKVAKTGRALCVDDYSTWEGRSPRFEGLGLASLIGVPLLVQDRVVGVLNIADDLFRGGFSEVDEALLLRLAPLAALAIERARLYSQTEAQLANVRLAHQEINALQELTAAIQSSLSLPDVLDRIAEGVVHGLGYRAAMVAVYEPQRDALVIQSAVLDREVWAKGEALTGMDLLGAFLTMDREENLAIRAARRGEVAFTHKLVDLFRPAVSEEMAQLLQQMAGVNALATVPLMANGQLVGNFFAGSSQDSISEADIASLKAFARQAALAIENARLYAEAQRNWRDQEYLQEIARVFNSTLDLQQVLTLVMTKTNELLGVEAGSVALLSEDRQELAFHASAGGGANIVRGFRMPADEGIVGWVVSHGKSLLVPDVAQDPRHYGQVDVATGFKTRSILCVPLVSKGKTLGAIEVVNKREGSFDDDDLRMTEALALSAAPAIENAMLFQREEQALERLKETQDELVRAQRMAALGQIGVTVGHEVNNPLTVVLGNTDWLLQEATGLKGESLRALEAIRANALRIRDIVNKLEDIRSDRVMEYVTGIEMIDIHNQGIIEEKEEDVD